MAPTLRQRLWLGLGVGVFVALAATGAFGGFGSSTRGTAAAISLTGAARPTLAVVIKGLGSVSSKPAGIRCPPVCKAKFAVRTSVHLIAKTKKSSLFRRWGGACTGAGARGVCKVRLSSSVRVSAEFVRGAAPPPKTVVEPGFYSGTTSQKGNRITFFVPPRSANVLNISIPSVFTSCITGGAVGDHLFILKARLKRDHTFTAKTSQSGVLSGSARFTYSITGRFQRKPATGAVVATGRFREDLTYLNGAARCTSNIQSWRATRARQPAKANRVAPGSYSGTTTPDANSVTLDVPAGAANVLNFSIPTVYLYCSPGGAIFEKLLISTAPIKQDHSFTATTSESGVANGRNATFTYSVAGYFQGVNAAGKVTAAGVFREDVVFENETTPACSSNDQIWTAIRTP